MMGPDHPLQYSLHGAHTSLFDRQPWEIRRHNAGLLRIVQDVHMTTTGSMHRDRLSHLFDILLLQEAIECWRPADGGLPGQADWDGAVKSCVQAAIAESKDASRMSAWHADAQRIRLRHMSHRDMDQLGDSFIAEYRDSDVFSTSVGVPTYEFWFAPRPKGWGTREGYVGVVSAREVVMSTKQQPSANNR